MYHAMVPVVMHGEFAEGTGSCLTFPVEQGCRHTRGLIDHARRNRDLVGGGGDHWSVADIPDQGVGFDPLNEELFQVEVPLLHHVAHLELVSHLEAA